MKTIMGICKTLEGEISFQGEIITKKCLLSEREGRDWIYASGQSMFYPRLSVEENLIIGQKVNIAEKNKKPLILLMSTFRF